MTAVMQSIFFLICISIKSGEGLTELVVSDRTIAVNKSVTMNCSSVNLVATGVTYNFKKQLESNLTIQFFKRNGNCQAFWIGLSINISFFCVSDNLFSLQILKVPMNFHNSSVSCSLKDSSNSNDERSAEIVLEVAVPVLGVELDGNVTVPLTVIENNEINLKCTTHPSYPAPNVTWHRTYGQSKTVEIHTGDIVLPQKHGDSHLIVVESNLTLNVSRDFNGTSIYCTASNGFGVDDFVSSSKIQLCVQYPPSKPEVVFKNQVIEKSVNVTKGNPLSLVCSSDGYPPPSFFWIQNGTVISKGKLLNITATLEIHNGTYVCFVNNSMIRNHVGESEKEISLLILIPPSRPVFYFNGSSENVINHMMSVVKNDSFTVICKSTGVPDPVCSWEMTVNNMLTEMRVQEDFERMCFASSTMVETAVENKLISVNATLVVDVLYPPSAPTIQFYTHSGLPQNVTDIVTVEEFSSLNLTCSAVSKPDVNNYTWSGQKHFLFKKVILHNISRHDDGLYTCHASNSMNRSFGKEQLGESSTTITIEVLYASEVTEFFVSSHKENSTAIAKQMENATFHCNVDSNPNSSIALHFKDKLLVNDTNSKSLTYLIRNTSCNNAGIYYCYSSNRINSGKHSKRQLTLIVKCPPLPENDVEVVNVPTLKYVSAVLTFKAKDYLDSENTTFTWQKENNASEFEPVKHDTSDVKIATFNLQTNLTIVNVTGYYSGKYRVVYNNSVGGNTQLFQLSVADLPDPPKFFNYFKSSLTSTKVTVFWTKGYGGGLKQTFVLDITQTSQPFKSDYIIETENETMQHTITGLSSGTQYDLTLWAKNDLGKSLSLTVTVLTKEPGHRTSSNLMAPIAGSVSSLAVIVAGMVIAFMLYKRRTSSARKSETGKLVYQNVIFDDKHQKRHKTNAPNVREITKAHDMRVKPKTKEETSFQVLQEVDDMPSQYTERTEYYNSAEKIAEIEKIKVSELLPYVLGRGEESFETEYQKLPTGLEHSCTFARKPENIALNRYQGIYPYDHSRVKIEGMPEFFINACYINGYTREKEYIASLGPTKKVTYDFQTFWLMVWNERSDIIVMLTNLHEPSGMKCEQYWPEYETTQFYGDIQVSSDREEVFAEYTVRVFTVSNSGERRTVTHLHYTAWPDKKVPEDVTTLIEFRERLKATASAEKGPVIVHCSAGIGRTGTLIALDRLIKEGQNESAVDVFKCVNSMREQRVKMVQTLEQYIYIYKALVNSLYFNCENIPLESFNEYVDTTNNNIYSNQFQQLKETVEDCIKEKSDTHAESEMLVDKNRRGADIPGRQFRVLVYLNRNMDDSDYINAVYANSFRIKDHFILAQSPLPNTVTDFVCMMYQENCSCVVTMEDLKEPGMKVGHYLPTDGQPLRFGDIQISCTVLETKPQYTVREMRLQNKRQTENREKVAYHFHYTKWMQGNDTPTDAKAFVQFIKDVEDYADQLGEGQSHVLVHCIKANERSALYSIVTILTEKIRYERQVSVLNTVRHLRTRRRTAITSMEQLKFCYQAVKAYINLFES